MSQFEVDLTMLPLTIPEFAVKFKLENQIVTEFLTWEEFNKYIKSFKEII